MSGWDIVVCAAAWLLLLRLVGRKGLREVLADFRDGLAAPDRRRHIADCSAYGGKLVPRDLAALRAFYEAADRAEVERRAAEGFARYHAALLEIRALPQVEPRRRLM